MEYRVHITLPGFVEEHEADRLLDALIASVGGWGPVLAHDLTAQTTDVTVAVEEPRGMLDAAVVAGVAVAEVITSLGWPFNPERVEVELVRDDAPAAAA